MIDMCRRAGLLLVTAVLLLACPGIASAVESGEAKQTGVAITTPTTPSDPLPPPTTPTVPATTPQPGPSGGITTNLLTVHNYSAHSGCVTVFVRYIDNSSGEDWLELKGQMAGCRRGHLYLHTYVNTAVGTLFADGEHNDCENSTSCETIWSNRILYLGPRHL